MEFNNGQRAHLNLVEQLPIWLVTLMVSGMILPQVAMWGGLIVTFFRILNSVMIISCGIESRIIGVIGGNLPLYLAMFVTTGFVIYNIANSEVSAQ